MDIAIPMFFAGVVLCFTGFVAIWLQGLRAKPVDVLFVTIGLIFIAISSAAI